MHNDEDGLDGSRVARGSEMGLRSEATESIAVSFDGIGKVWIGLKSASSRNPNEVSYVDSDPCWKYDGTVIVDQGIRSQTEL